MVDYMEGTANLTVPTMDVTDGGSPRRAGGDPVIPPSQPGFSRAFLGTHGLTTE